MTIPEVPELLLPVLRIGPKAGEFRASDHYASLADQFGLSQEECTLMQDGGGNTIFGNRVSWALVQLSRRRLITKVRPGWYRLTDEGRRAADAGQPIESPYRRGHEVTSQAGAERPAMNVPAAQTIPPEEAIARLS